MLKDKVKELLYTDGVIVVRENHVGSTRFVNVIVVEDVTTAYEYHNDELVFVRGEVYVRDIEKMKGLLK